MDNSGENVESQVKVTINKPKRVLHFSDGVEEEMEEEIVSELKSEPQREIDPKTLTWIPWVSHHASKSGTKILNVVDYAGESLASFFGITTPKYQIEIDEHERIMEEKRKMDEESAGWTPKNPGTDIPLVLNEPVKEVKKEIV